MSLLGISEEKYPERAQISDKVSNQKTVIQSQYSLHEIIFRKLQTVLITPKAPR